MKIIGVRIVCAVFLSAVLVRTAQASVPIGENILVNGALEADQVDFPQGWTFFPTSMVRPDYHPSGGPSGKPHVTFSHTGEAASGERTMRQYGIGLAPNGTYRLTAWVRPSADFKAATFNLLVINKGWKGSWGVRKPPAPGKWTKVSETIRGFSSEGDYFFAIVLNSFHGTVDVADLRLEAVDEAAAAGAEQPRLSAYQSAPRLVPWSPLLGEIPRTTREVTFRFFGQLPKGDAFADYRLTLAVGSAGTVSAPLSAGDIRLRLPAGTDEGVLTAKVEKKADKSVLVGRDFRYRVVDVPTAAQLKGHRRLNNYVTEVLRADLSGGEETLTFAVARRKWTIVAVKSSAAVTVALDGQPVLAAPERETFREVGPGVHALAIAGAAAGDKVVVRTIPEIINYCPAPSVVKENPPFDWAFQKKHVLPAVTTMNGGHRPDEAEFAAFRARGYKWVANLITRDPKDDTDIGQRLAACEGMTSPRFDGVTCDEQFCGRDAVNSRYMLGLRAYDLASKPERAIYTWLVGKPLSGIFDPEFLADCANASLGRSMVLTETYCRTKESEVEARAYVDTYIRETMRRYKSAYAGILPSIGMVLGNFVQLPVASLHHHCQVDYKYYLDLQMNVLANDPELDGVGLAGYWGSYYIDEETLRWSFKLIRHYCINGATDSLAERLGMKYIPGFVANPDFRKGLAGWTATGAVATDRVKDFGSQSLGLYGGADGLGDDFAVLTRGETPNRLSQRVKGLVPGQMYVLQFVTFDADDAQNHVYAPRRFGVAADLVAGAEVDAARSWTHVDRRHQGRYSGMTGGAKVNLNHVVFTARAPEIDLAFTDAGEKPGEKTGLNWIYFAKYFK